MQDDTELNGGRQSLLQQSHLVKEDCQTRGISGLIDSVSPGWSWLNLLLDRRNARRGGSQDREGGYSFSGPAGDKYCCLSPPN